GGPPPGRPARHPRRGRGAAARRPGPRARARADRPRVGGHRAPPPEPGPPRAHRPPHPAPDRARRVPGRNLMIKKLLAVLLLVATGTACATAGNGGGAPADTVTLRIGDQKAGSRAVLEAAGLLEGTPYRITWAQFTSGPPLLEAVHAGAVDIGGVGNTPPIFAAAAGSRITVVAAFRQNPVGAAILVPDGSPITTPAQLKGKRVAVAKGSSAHYHLLAVLKQAGLSFADIQPQYLQPADALAAFSSGTVDAWAIWEPFTSQARLEHKARVLTDGTAYVNGLNFQVASPAALQDPAKEAAIRDFLERLAKARTWAISHQSE